MTALDPREVEFLNGTRRAVLGTVSEAGVPRLVPICFALIDATPGPVIVSALDEKPKRTADSHQLARVRDLQARPDATLLADRWDEDWTRLAWLRVEARATLLEPGHPEHAPAVQALRARYEPYRAQRLEDRPILRFEPIRTVWWSAD